jgi:uncharacterized protein (DUF58 family)
VIGAAWWWLLAALYLLGALTRDPRLFLFCLMLTVASLASALWARYALAELHYRRSLGHDRLSFGEETQLTLEVYNAKPLPLPWVLISDQYPEGLTLLTGELSASRSVSFRHALVNFLALRWYERVRRVYRVRGDNRGVYRFGPADIHAGDIFGFRRQRLTVEQRDELVVHPRVMPVEALGLPAARPVGEATALRRVVEDPLRYHGVREYAPGDSLRYVHWKATARTRTLQTRTFDPGASHSIMLMLDVQTTERPYTMVRDHLELLICAAASLAEDGLEHSQAVGLLANSGPPETSGWTYVPPSRHPGQAVALLDALARLTGFRLMSFARLLSVIGSRLPYGCTIVALSAQADEEAQETLVRLQDIGYPVLLLTAGDAAPTITAEIETHHLGGSDAWQSLEKLELA